MLSASASLGDGDCDHDGVDDDGDGDDVGDRDVGDDTSVRSITGFGVE